MNTEHITVRTLLASLVSLALLVSLGLGLPATAEVYKWTDENGRVHYGDAPRESDRAERVEIEINTYESVSYESLGTFAFPERKQAGKVVMYSTAWCGACKRARRYFQANNIPFTEHDIEKSEAAREAFDKLGARGVPVILVGDKRMNGFSEKGFERLRK